MARSSERDARALVAGAIAGVVVGVAVIAALLWPDDSDDDKSIRPAPLTTVVTETTDGNITDISNTG